jgi:hypothetical protein
MGEVPASETSQVESSWPPLPAGSGGEGQVPETAPAESTWSSLPLLPFEALAPWTPLSW